MQCQDALAHCCLLGLRADVQTLQCLHEDVQGRAGIADGQKVPSSREQLVGFRVSALELGVHACMNRLVTPQRECLSTMSSSSM